MDEETINVIQINLGHGSSAQSNLLTMEFDIALISEPYVGRSGLIGSTPNYNCFQVKTGTEVRAAILVSKRYSAILCNGSDSCSVKIQVTFGQTVIEFVSVYWPKHRCIEAQLAKLSRMIQNCSDNLIIGGDFNGRHSSWGDPKTDSRGRVISEEMLENNFKLLNIGNEPTFLGTRNGLPRSSIIDLTWCSLRTYSIVNNWHVSDEVTLSDHKAVRFSLTITNSQTEATVKRYNMKRCNWDKFHDVLDKRIHEINEETIKTFTLPAQIMATVGLLLLIITDALDSSTPIFKQGRRPNPWWSPELSVLREAAKVAGRRLKDARTEGRKRSTLAAKLLADSALKVAIKAAKLASWKLLLDSIDPTTAWSKLIKILRAGYIPQPSTIMVGCNRTSSNQDTADALISHFFPYDDPNDDSIEHSRLRQRIGLTSDSSDDPPFTIEELLSSVNSFSNKKAPGSDGLSTDICKNTIIRYPEKILAVFNSCLVLGCFPPQFKEALIICVPKPGKEDLSNAKSYRPIGLLSIFGKMFEKMIVRRTEWHIHQAGMNHPNQFGFTPQKSTLDIVRHIVEFTRRVWSKKSYGIIISLDIAGAFDSAWWPFILEELRQAKLPRNLFELVRNYLSNRSARLDIAGATARRDITKGAVQGSIFGPSLFKLLIANLLRRYIPHGCEIKFYADDGYFTVSHWDIAILKSLASEVLGIIARWSEEAKMKIEPSKTQAMFVTRKKKYDLPVIIFEGHPLKFVNEIKVLGILIDRNLSFGAQAASVAQRIRSASGNVMRASRPTWGASSEVMRTLITGALIPMALYGCQIWGDGLAKRHMKKITSSFLPVIRRACKGYRTISEVAAYAISGIIPIDLQIEEHALLENVLRGQHNYQELHDCEIEARISPYDLPHPARRKRVNTKMTELGAEISYKPAGYIDIFTDGSKIEKKIGAGLVIYQQNCEIGKHRFKLGSYCSVFQAECLAVQKALEWRIQFAASHDATRVFTDSKSLVEGILDINTTNIQLANIIRLSNDLRDRNIDLEIHWIRGHQDLLGNDKADELAREAGESLSRCSYIAAPYSFVKRCAREITHTNWTSRYQSAAGQMEIRNFFTDPGKARKFFKLFQPRFDLTQIFSGHGANKAYLKRFKILQCDICDCQQGPQTICHLINHCAIFSYERSALEARLLESGFQVQNWSALLENRSIQSSFVSFIAHISKEIYQRNSNRRNS